MSGICAEGNEHRKTVELARTYGLVSENAGGTMFRLYVDDEEEFEEEFDDEEEDVEFEDEELDDLEEFDDDEDIFEEEEEGY